MSRLLITAGKFHLRSHNRIINELNEKIRWNSKCRRIVFTSRKKSWNHFFFLGRQNDGKSSRKSVRIGIGLSINGTICVAVGCNINKNSRQTHTCSPNGKRKLYFRFAEGKYFCSHFPALFPVFSHTCAWRHELKESKLNFPGIRFNCKLASHIKRKWESWQVDGNSCWLAAIAFHFYYSYFVGKIRSVCRKIDHISSCQTSIHSRYVSSDKS